MQPSIALIIVCVCILGAFVVDSRRRPQASYALWIPLIWTAVIASRPVVLWFSSGHATFDANLEDGSAIDRTLLSALMAIAGVVLYNRRVRWGKWLRQNGWIVAFFVYCGLSVLWSDFPAIAIKRWIRAIGSVMMILVVLTEEDPVEAVATLMRRCTYVLVPMSVVLIKYYRDRAVGYNPWTGEEYLVGVTTDKNALGRLCLLSGLFLFWELLTAASEKKVDKLNRLATLAVLVCTLWLLRLSKSSTSLGTFILGASCLLVLTIPMVQRNARHLGSLFLVATCAIVLTSVSFDLVEFAVSKLGRDMTFTDRTFVWADLMAMRTNPILGVGYDSFWLGERLERFIRVHQVTEAHNGYIEVYLELGSIGLMIFLGIVVSAFFKGKKQLLDQPRYGRIRLAILAVFLLYNVTEAGYKPTTSIFFVLLLVTIEAPEKVREGGPVLATVRTTPEVSVKRSPLADSHAGFGVRRFEGKAFVPRVLPSSHRSGKTS